MRTSDLDPISVDIFNRQLKKATLLVLVVFGVLVLRLWFLQIVNGSTYRTKSENNRIQLQDILPFRGVITDRTGKILVGNRPSYDLYVIPEGMQDKGQLLRSLNRLIGLDPVLAERKLNRASPIYPFRPICIKKDMSRNELAVIETHRFNLPGVMIKVKPQRHYTNGSFASHLLGYLGEINQTQLRSRQYPNSKGGDLIGKSGVELKWEPFLSGKRGGEQVEVDAAGRKIRVISWKPPLSGATICLTIDKGLQTLAEKALGNRKGAIVAVDPNDGQILALASSPSFDPNIFIRGIDRATWKKISSSKEFPLQNRALSGLYPPGSVFKIIVAVASLEEGIIDPEETVFCNGAYTLGTRTYRCWKEHGHGNVNVHMALKESCDVYFYRMGKRLGIDRIARYARMFGLGKTTGFDTGQEKGGLIPDNTWKLRKFGIPWQAGETLSISIGQSFLLVTPIQMVNLISAVFNGGILYKPQLTRWAGRNPHEKFYEFSPEIAGRVGVRQKYLEIVKKALVGVVNEPRGTGWRARLRNITIAGKTGTAQVITLEKEKVMEQSGEIPLEFRDHAWFLAIAPADKPRIALAVVVEHGGHGGSTCGPIAKKLISAYLEDR